MSALIGAVGVGVAAVAQLIITILILGGKADSKFHYLSHYNKKY